MEFTVKTLSELALKIRRIEAEIESLIAERRARFHYAVERNRVWFEPGIQAGHRAFRLGLRRQIRQSSLAVVLVSPIIYSLILPLVLLDLFVVVYQAVCFRVYGIQRVSRADFIVMDRHHLAYLNPLEKLNCVYCGYANGVIAFAREIGARTEAYWCPIKYSRHVPAPHSRYVHFADYGDAENYRQRLDELRKSAEPAEGG